MSYTLEVLTIIATSNEARVIGELPTLSKNARISFQCKCGNEHNKSFVQLKKVGMLCKQCTTLSKREKREKTNLEKYGTTCTLQADSVKRKSEETCLKKYGVKNALSASSIQEKIRQTNVSKYGVENPFAAEVCKKKLRETCKQKYGSEFPTRNKEVINKIQSTNMKRYGVPVSSQAECVKQKAIETNIKLYGCAHHIVPSVKDKIKESNRQRYGVDYSFQAESVKQKIKNTLMKRYGVDHIMKSAILRKKILETNLRKYGVSHSMKLRTYQDKAMYTVQQRYGVKYVNQSPIIQAKTQKKGIRFKSYCTPSGSFRKVQGYEPFALNILFQQFQEEDVLTERTHVPRIIYKDSNNTEHYYFPDIYVKSINKVIEVKSTWTFTLHKEVNILKWKATMDLGYQFECWIFDKKGECTVYIP